MAIDERYEETVILLQKVWVFFVIALYCAGFMNEYHFPGAREEPLEKEEILWNAQRVLFFAVMFAGLLIDVVRMRVDRDKAFVFLFLSLALGGLSGAISALQYQALAALFGRAETAVSTSSVFLLPTLGFT